MSERHPGRFVASFVALVVLAGGAPLGLLAAARLRFGSANPLAGVEAPWSWNPSDVSNVLSGPLGDDAVIDTIVRDGLIVVWAAVAVIVVTVVSEFVHAVRHRGLPLPEVRGLGWAQRIARFIVVGLLTVLPVMAPT